MADASRINGNPAGTSQGSSDEVWKKNARASTGAFRPLPLQGKPNIKTLEPELQRQLAHAHQQTQQDLDLLHEQVHAEVHAAISRELQGVAKRLSEVGKAAEAGRREAEPLRGALEELRREAQQAQQERRQLEAGAAEARAAGQAAAEAAAAGAAGAVAEELRELVASEAAALRGELAALREQLAQELVAQLRRAETARAEAEAGLRRELEGGTGGLSRQLDELAQQVVQINEEVRSAGAERQQLATKLEGLESEKARAEESLAELGAALRGEAAVGEARFQELQAAMAEVEGRLAASLQRSLEAVTERSEGAQHQMADSLGDDLKERLSSLAKDVKERLISMDAKFHRLDAECADGLEFASASWARAMEWKAGVNVEQLESNGRIDVESPLFTVAGLRNLQLVLRVHSSSGRGEDSRSTRWTCGAFLRAPEGQVSFRLHINGRSQTFAGDFAETGEWGSQRIALFDRLDTEIPVKLEILDVTARLSASKSLPSCLSATLQITDATQTAVREVACLRSAFVRKVEWRIARVSERLVAARAASGMVDNDGAFEPLCSPPFAAAGLEGLQLQLYPLGYRARTDEMCGFFLVCPKGTSVKCRAFVGDASRMFEYHYETREPCGRGSFCRLADKINEDDTITCGVEFIEVKQEQTTQVRGGPFGKVADELKIVSGPANGGMEAVRELREVQGGSRDMNIAFRTKGTRQRQATGVADRVVPMASKTSSGLVVSKSLPVLLPAVGAGTAGPGLGTYTTSTPTRRQADFTLMR